MADTMQFDLVSPEKAVASFQATAVQIPGADGDMTAMAGHAATITTLRAGILSVESAEGKSDYAVTGGFAEISAEGTSVLAEKAVAVADMTVSEMDGLIAKASVALESAEDKDLAAKQVADLEALKIALGL